MSYQKDRFDIAQGKQWESMSLQERAIMEAQMAHVEEDKRTEEAEMAEESYKESE